MMFCLPRIIPVVAPFLAIGLLVPEFAFSFTGGLTTALTHHQYNKRYVVVSSTSFVSPSNIIIQEGFENQCFRLFLSHVNDDDNNGRVRSPSAAVEEELENLKNQLTLIEALEARNESQIDSFVDEEDQWNSMEEEDRTLLQSKDSILERMELLTEQLIQLWMGQKSMDG